MGHHSGKHGTHKNRSFTLAAGSEPSLLRRQYWPREGRINIFGREKRPSRKVLQPTRIRQDSTARPPQAASLQEELLFEQKTDWKGGGSEDFMYVYMMLHEQGEGDLCFFHVFKRGCLVLGFSRCSKRLLRGVMHQLDFLVFSDLTPHMHVYLLWKSEYMSASLRHLSYLCTSCPPFLSHDCSLISWEPCTNKQSRNHLNMSPKCPFILRRSSRVHSTWWVSDDKYRYQSPWQPMFHIPPPSRLPLCPSLVYINECTTKCVCECVAVYMHMCLCVHLGEKLHI